MKLLPDGRYFQLFSIKLHDECTPVYVDFEYVIHGIHAINHTAAKSWSFKLDDLARMIPEMYNQSNYQVLSAVPWTKLEEFMVRYLCLEIFPNPIRNGQREAR